MNTMNKMVLTALAASVLTACSGAGQDEGNSATYKVNGRAIDGPVTQAVVYIDTNGNNMRDSWEESAYTDGEGYFSFNPNKVDDKLTADAGDDVVGFNYCKYGAEVLDKPAGEPDEATQPTEYAAYIATLDYKKYLRSVDSAKYCLQITEEVKSAPIRVTGGYDAYTGEKFVGTMTLNANFASATTSSPAAVTPVTAMLYAASESGSVFPATEAVTDQAKLKSDFMDLSNSLTEAERRAMIRIALTSQKVSEVIASYIDAQTTNKFGGATTAWPYDIVPFVQAEIAKSISGAATLHDVASADLSAEILAAWTAVYNKLTAEGQVFDAPNSAMSATIASRINNGTDSLASIILAIFPDLESMGADATAQATYIKGRMRTVEVLAALMRDPTVTQANVDKILADADDPAFLAAMSDPKADVGYTVAFVQTAGYTGPASLDFSLRQSLPITDGTGAISVGTAGSGTNLDFNFNPDGTVDVGGNLDLDGADGTVDTTTTYEQIDDNTVVMNVEVAPGIYQPVVVKTDPDGTGYLVDYGEGLTSF